jgi:hypothetical protein
LFDFAAVAVQFHMNPHSKSPWLALYVPYLVINRTGLPIRVRPFYDEKKKKTVNPEHADRMRQLQQVEWSRETQADFNAALHGVTIHKGDAALHRSISKHPVVKRHSQTEFADAVNDPMPLLLGSAATWKECEMLQLSLDGTTYSNLEFNEPPTNAKEPLKVRTAAHLPPVLPLACSHSCTLDRTSASHDPSNRLPHDFCRVHPMQHRSETFRFSHELGNEWSGPFVHKAPNTVRAAPCCASNPMRAEHSRGPQGMPQPC